MKNKYMLILEMVFQVLKVWLIIFHKFLELLKKNFMTLFYGWGSTNCLKARATSSSTLFTYLKNALFQRKKEGGKGGEDNGISWGR